MLITIPTLAQGFSPGNELFNKGQVFPLGQAGMINMAWVEAMFIDIKPMYVKIDVLVLLLIKVHKQKSVFQNISLCML